MFFIVISTQKIYYISLQLKVLNQSLTQRFSQIQNSRFTKLIKWNIVVGNKKLGELFIKHKVDKDATTKDYQQTPLHYAVKYGQIEFSELLISHGVKINMAGL